MAKGGNHKKVIKRSLKIHKVRKLSGWPKVTGGFKESYPVWIGLWSCRLIQSSLALFPSPLLPHRHLIILLLVIAKASVGSWLPDKCKTLQLQVERLTFYSLDFSSCVPLDSGEDGFSGRAFCKGYQHFLTFQRTLYPLLFSAVFPPFTLWYFPIFPPSDSLSIMNFPVFSSRGSSPFPSPMGSHLLYCISHSLYSVPLR